MQFLKTAFWVALAVVIVLFTVGNWTLVRVNLWGDLQMETRLPVLVITAFLVGAIPFWGLYRATLWRYRRRLETAERALAVHTAPTPPPSGTAEPTTPQDPTL